MYNSNDTYANVEKRTFDALKSSILAKRLTITPFPPVRIKLKLGGLKVRRSQDCYQNMYCTFVYK